MRRQLYSERNDEIVALITRLMRTDQQPLLDRLIRALKGLYPPEVVEYLRGVYCLEFGKTHVLGRGRFVEMGVSFRCARRHLKRALRAKPQDAEILTAIGDSYCKELRPAQALAYCEKALALVPDNARFAWNLMEQSYLLANYEKVLSCDAAFDWEACTDRARCFWCGVVCAYSAAALGKMGQLHELASRVLNAYAPELPQPDLAAACLLDVLFLAGRLEELEERYARCARDAEFVSSPLLCLMREGKALPPRQELAAQIIAAFTPRNLLPHLAW